MKSYKEYALQNERVTNDCFYSPAWQSRQPVEHAKCYGKLHYYNEGSKFKWCDISVAWTKSALQHFYLPSWLWSSTMRLLEQTKIILFHSGPHTAHKLMSCKKIVLLILCSVDLLISAYCVTHLYFFTMKMQRTPKIIAVPIPTTDGMMMWL